MGHVIGVVAGGFLFAATGTTAAEALDALCAEYGEAMAVRYAEALAALDAPSGHAPGIPDAVLPGGTPSPTVEPDVPVESDPVARGADGGTDQPAPLQGTGQGTGAEAEAEGCDICGGAVPADWAGVSRQLHGAVRCLACTT